MKDINNVIIIGRLVREPEISYTQSGVCIAKFSIANDNSVKDKEEVDYFDVTAFKNTAEYIMKYIKKGYKVGISGRLSQQRWTDQNSVNHSKVIILANEIEIMSSPQAQGQGQNAVGTNQNPFAPNGINPAPIPQQYQQDEGRYGVFSSPSNPPAPQNPQPTAAAQPQTQNDGFSADNPYSPQNWANNPANPNVQNGQLFDPPADASPWDEGFYNDDNIPL